jgi:hypothetical protein
VNRLSITLIDVLVILSFRLPVLSIIPLPALMFWYNTSLPTSNNIEENIAKCNGENPKVFTVRNILSADNPGQ